MLDGRSDLAALGVGDAFSCSEPSGSAGDKKRHRGVPKFDRSVQVIHETFLAIKGR